MHSREIIIVFFLGFFNFLRLIGLISPIDNILLESEFDFIDKKTIGIDMREKLLGFDVDHERQNKKLRMRSVQTDTKEGRKSSIQRKKRRGREKTLRG